MEDKTESSGSPATSHPCDRCKGWLRKKIKRLLDELSAAKSLVLISTEEGNKQGREEAIRKGITVRAEAKVLMPHARTYRDPCMDCGDRGYDETDLVLLKNLVDDFYGYGKELEKETGQPIDFYASIRIVDR